MTSSVSNRQTSISSGAALSMAVALACSSCGTGGGGGGTEGGAESSGGGPSTTAPAEASGPATEEGGGETTGAPASTGGGEGPPPIKLDLGNVPDVPASACEGADGGGGGAGNPDFSYIWIANSNESTVSKIDTQTLAELGRYITRPDSNGSPSRTSVSLSGDVAVANRNGGVVKIAAVEERCPDPGNTSSGAGDVKAFPDGCVVWYTPFAYSSQRPVAWAPGEFNEAICGFVNEKLWTSGSNASIDVLLLDGETGVAEQVVPIPGVNPDFYGIYGGAVDRDGNFWGSQLGQGFLVHVDRNDFEVQTFAMPQSGYGMTVDEMGRPFTCNQGVARFDPDSQSWQTNPNVGGGGGCMVDGLGTLWIGGGLGGGAGQLIGVDTESLAVKTTIPIPQYVHGISIDFYGYVWGVTLQQPWAYRVDPESQTVDTFAGLNGPYSYSDMTGYALSNAIGSPPPT